jgi:hypothetical protein
MKNIRSGLFNEGNRIEDTMWESCRKRAGGGRVRSVWSCTMYNLWNPVVQSTLPLSSTNFVK